MSRYIYYIIKKLYRYSYNYYLLARLDKPSAIFLLALPAFWSFALSSNYDVSINILDKLYFYTFFLVGSIFIRSFACVVNDILDAKIDSSIQRTKSRPIASGKISIFGAVVFALILGGISLSILLTLNKFAVIIGLMAAVLMVIYPLIKRYSYYPQVFLGLTMAFSVLLSSASLNQGFSYYTVILYVITVLWVIGYDTIYSIQDYYDDRVNGVKSIAVLFGEKAQNLIAYIYLSVILCLFLLGYLMEASLLYYIFILMALLHFIWQVININFYKLDVCKVIFNYNVYVGTIIWIALIIS